MKTKKDKIRNTELGLRSPNKTKQLDKEGKKVK